MPNVTIAKSTGLEDNPAVFMDRIKGSDGANITQASLSTITYGIWDSSGTAVVSAGTSLTVSSVVFDTLQTSTDDARWDGDSTGFNFQHEVAADVFTEPDECYDIEWVFTPASGDAFKHKRQHVTIPIHTS